MRVFIMRVFIDKKLELKRYFLEEVEDMVVLYSPYGRRVLEIVYLGKGRKILLTKEEFIFFSGEVNINYFLSTPADVTIEGQKCIVDRTIMHIDIPGKMLQIGISDDEAEAKWLGIYTTKK